MLAEWGGVGEGMAVNSSGPDGGIARWHRTPPQCDDTAGEGVSEGSVEESPFFDAPTRSGFGRAARLRRGGSNPGTRPF